MNRYAALQNGSDIRGVALEGVAGETVNLTPAAVQDLACAFTHWLAARSGKPAGALSIALGRDSRLSGANLAAAATKGVTTAGAKVIDCAMASTPAMFMSTVLQGHGYDGALMLTASHLPFNRNGMKFFTPAGGLEKADITAIITTADALPAPAATKGTVIAADLIADYAANLVGIIRKEVNNKTDYNQPLKGFKIAVDAGNGAGGFFATKVLDPLGADTSASRYLEPDGSFPNHVPNPEDKAAMAAITEAVVKNGCDLGLIFDTDVDRAGAVDATGHEINRNRLIALMAAIVLENVPGGTIVTDSVTSTHLKTFIEQRLGGVHHRFKRGYKNVINEAIRLESIGTTAPLAIETSGHGALKENYFLDDGAYICAKILIKAAKLRAQGKTVAQMLSDLQEPAESTELRFKIAGDSFGEYGKMVIQKLLDYATQQGWDIAKDNHEGVRIYFTSASTKGWFLLRLSLHDPIMPLNIEADVPGGVQAIARQLHSFLQQMDRLDLSPLEKLV